MNKIILLGRLTKDPEINTSSNTTIARYGIAVDRKFKRDGQPDADFFNCVAFGNSAVFAEKYLKKGTKILLDGRIESDEYTNRDGVRVKSWSVVVDSQEFAESKASAEANAQATAPKSESHFVNIPDDVMEELPFM